MNTEQMIPGTDEAWENETLGADANFAEIDSDVDEGAIDRALELQPISIRLQKSLIEDFKMIAQLHGIGYQPLMRQVLARFSEAEKKRVLREVVAEARTRQERGVENERSGTLS
jgi:predicted DNA binding CopG/RHH family protein